MIIQCLCCGKSISTKKDICPYCKYDITHISTQLSGETTKVAVKEKLKGTILSLVLR